MVKKIVSIVLELLNCFAFGFLISDEFRNMGYQISSAIESFGESDKFMYAYKYQALDGILKENGIFIAVYIILFVIISLVLYHIGFVKVKKNETHNNDNINQ